MGTENNQQAAGSSAATCSRILCPLERQIAESLKTAGIDYKHEMDGGTKGLDFYLPEMDLYIEVKGGHADRVAKQTARATNVIVLQGKRSVDLMGILLRAEQL